VFAPPNLDCVSYVPHRPGIHGLHAVERDDCSGDPVSHRDCWSFQNDQLVYLEGEGFCSWKPTLQGLNACKNIAAPSQFLWARVPHRCSHPSEQMLRVSGDFGQHLRRGSDGTTPAMNRAGFNVCYVVLALWDRFWPGPTSQKGNSKAAGRRCLVHFSEGLEWPRSGHARTRPSWSGRWRA